LTRYCFGSFRRWAGTLVADDVPQADAELNEVTLIPRVMWNMDEINCCQLKWVNVNPQSQPKER